MNESAKPVSALDDSRWLVHGLQFLSGGIGRLEAEGAVRVGCINSVSCGGLVFVDESAE